MEGQLSSLSEGFLAPFYPTDEGLLIGMGVLVLFEVLGQSEGFRAKCAAVGFDFGVDVVMAFEGKLRGELFLTTGKLTLEHLFFLHMFIQYYNYISVLNEVIIRPLTSKPLTF